MTRRALQSVSLTVVAAGKPCPACKRPWRREFSSSPTWSLTRLRSDMFVWLKTRGKVFESPLESGTNYLTDYDKSGGRRDDYYASADRQDNSDQRPRRPFPLNEHFISQSILSEDLKEAIWRRVRVEKMSIRAVSVEFGVEMRRVGAVVRLKEVEKKWRAEDKAFATPYAEAIHSMVPLTPLKEPPQAHEPINDLPVHRMTTPQLFYPTSESRQFSRVDAGRVFSGAPRLPDEVDIGQGGQSAESWKDTQMEMIGRPGHERPVLKAADVRIPHPHLIAYEKDRVNEDLAAFHRTERYDARLADETQQRAQRKEAQRAREELHTTKVQTTRCDFLFKDCSTTRLGTGLDGRGTASPGLRYGVPSQEGKRGVYKLPRKVEV